MATIVVGEDLTPGGPVTSVTLAHTPIAGTDKLFVAGYRLRRVGGAPGVGEYLRSGAVCTVGFTIDANIAVLADYQY